MMTTIFDSKNNYFFFLLFFQVLVFFYIFGPFNFGPTTYRNLINNYDGPSYYNFSFDNLKIVLSQHRTFGFPLFMKLYRMIDNDLFFWPHINFLIYISAINLLYFSLLRFNFNKIFIFLLCFGLVLSFSLYQYLNQYTEVISISFLLASISLMLLMIKYKLKKYYILFTFFLFFTYQIRTSMVIFVLFPVIFSLFYKFFINNNFKLKIIALLSLTPLFLFILLRFFVVNDAAPVSFNVGMAGNSIRYLEETDLKKLTKENQKLAKIFLERKKKLPYPCNLNGKHNEKVTYYKKLGRQNNYGQDPCWNKYLMGVWLDVIKIEKGMEPFPNGDSRNIAPWLHVETLANFWNEAGDNVKVNKIIKSFSFDVYMQNKKKVFLKIIKSHYYFIKMQRHENRNLLTIYAFLMIILFVFINTEKKDNKKFGLEMTFSLSFMIITLINLPILYVHENGDPRASLVQTFYFIPILASYLIYLFLINSKLKRVF
jgi:hypothetical protein